MYLPGADIDDWGILSFGCFQRVWFFCFQGDTLSETDDTTTSQLLTTREQESIEQNMSSELRRFITKRPEQLTINTQIGKYKLNYSQAFHFLTASSSFTNCTNPCFSSIVRKCSFFCPFRWPNACLFHTCASLIWHTVSFTRHTGPCQWRFCAAGTQNRFRIPLRSCERKLHTASRKALGFYRVTNPGPRENYRPCSSSVVI